MSDDLARELHNFDPKMGGAENPYIVNPGKQQSRMKIRKVYVCNNFIAAVWNYRNMGDRNMHYGYGRGRFSKSYYCFIFTVEDLWRAGFINVVSRAYHETLENFGKSLLPVTPSGCYKITWNGQGMRI